MAAGTVSASESALHRHLNRFSDTERLARFLGRYYRGKLPDDRVYTKRTVTDLLRRHRFALVEFRRVHMRPLSVGGPARAIWATSCALERVPRLNLAAKSFELVARTET